MSFIPEAHFHRTYVWIPLFGALVWTAMLTAMLITWLTTGRPKYASQEGSIAYISDVGTGFLKPLFIVGCSITAVAYFVSLSVWRWLGHTGRLPLDLRLRERISSALAVLCALAGGLGLILLSVFDKERYPGPHRIFLLMFLIGVALSAVFTIAEYFWISRRSPDYRPLKVAYIVKGIITILLLCLVNVFGIALFYKNDDVGAVTEWVIAFLFAFFLATFAYDLRLSKGSYKARYGTRNLSPQGPAQHRPLLYASA